jgi:hypothetical protein
MATGLVDDYEGIFTSATTMVGADDVMALALEVQQSRARRCQSCSKFKNWAWTEDGSGRCYGPVNGLVLPDFFCAAHTPEVPA